MSNTLERTRRGGEGHGDPAVVRSDSKSIARVFASIIDAAIWWIGVFLIATAVADHVETRRCSRSSSLG